MTEPRLPDEFVLRIRTAVEVLRGVGLNEAQIACIVQDIRSATLNEEFQRIRDLISDVIHLNPPHHHRWGDTMRSLPVASGA